MPPGDCEILRPFCCPADGAAMGAAAPGRGIWKGSKEGEAGRAAGRRGQGFGTPCVRGIRHSLHARPPRPCRDIRALRESLSPLSLRESLSPCPLRPAALPAWCLSFSFVRQHARARLLPWLRVAHLFAFVPVFARKYAILSDL
mgnify:FL=1